MASSTPNTSESTAPPSTAFPPDHLEHPESWATGSNPATTKQLDFIQVLEKQHHLDIDEEELEGIDKTDASELITGLKKGKVVLPHHHHHHEDEGKPGEKRPAEEKEEPEPEERKVKKRKVEEEGEEGAQAHEKEEDFGEDHYLEHPETWATGSDSATSKQLAFISLLAKQHPSFHLSPSKRDHLTKTEASEIIDGLKNGKRIPVDGLEEGEAEKEKEEVSKETGETDDASSSIKPATTKDAEKEEEEKPGTEDYLGHPESWATGEEPATEKQLAYLAVLEKQKGLEATPEEDKELGKSDASRKIEELKK